MSEVSKTEKERKLRRQYNENLPSFLKDAKKALHQELPLDEFSKTQTYKLHIEKLMECIISGNQVDEQTNQDILLPLSLRNRSKEVFDLLVSLGVLKKYQNLNVLKFKPLAFSPSQLDLSKRILNFVPLDKDEANRKDLREVSPQRTFAIDDKDSLEIDDSVGLDYRADGSVWVRIHIADPSRIMNFGDLLDLSVRERVSTVFLPEERFCMFHPSVIGSLFSLSPSRPNHVLSFFIKLDDEGSVVDYEIAPSIVDNILCMTYSQVDADITSTLSPTPQATPTTPPTTTPEDQKILAQLYEIAKSRRRWRENNNATIIDFPSPDITIKGNGDYVHVSPLESTRYSPARLMVEELMILVGDVCASFAIKHGVPIPFRTQQVRPGASTSVPAEQLADNVNGYQSPELSSWVGDLMNQWQSKTKLKPATCSLVPLPHAGLGLPAYCQATSPIRRYSDLLVHYQIKAVLRGEVPIPNDRLSSLVEELEVAQTSLNKLSAYSQRYWVLRYFERQNADRIFLSLVLSTSTTNEFSSSTEQQQQQKQRIQQSSLPSSYPQHYSVQLLLLDLGYKMNTSLFRASPPKCGELIQLMVQRVDAFYNDISFVDCQG